MVEVADRLYPDGDFFIEDEYQEGFMSDPMHPDFDRSAGEDSQQLFDVLAAEEPDVDAGDTNPSATKPRPAVLAGDNTGRWMGAAILFLALLMISGQGKRSTSRLRKMMVQQLRSQLFVALIPLKN